MRSTAAEMMPQCFTNVAFIRIGIAIEQGHDGNDHAIQTIPALGRSFFDKGRLNRVQMVRRSKTFKRGHLP